MCRVLAPLFDLQVAKRSRVFPGDSEKRFCVGAHFRGGRFVDQGRGEAWVRGKMAETQPDEGGFSMNYGGWIS